MHVGTNDFQRLRKETSVKAAVKLVKLITHKNQVAKIIISGIIPIKKVRPIDTKEQDDKRREVNKSLNNLAKPLPHTRLIHTWKKFIDTKTKEILRELYGKD